MTLIRQKAYAYITRATSLLVFRHPDFPEAGIQIVGGGLEPGETPSTAVLREAAEETGLSGFENPIFLGNQSFSLPDSTREEIHQRFFYHLRLTQTVPETWRTYELNPSDGSPGPIAFEHYWVDLRYSHPGLTADLDAFLPDLNVRLGL